MALSFLPSAYVAVDGTNYFGAGRHPDTQITLDRSGGTRPNGDFDKRYIPGDDQNGVFGPYYFTELYGRDSLLIPVGRVFNYDYHIKKDTFPSDKLTVQWAIGADECINSFHTIKYFLNDSLLTEYSGQEQANIVILQ